MSRPIMIPEHIVKREYTSASGREVAKVGGLIPGVDDIPFIRGDFHMQGEETVKEETKTGLVRKKKTTEGLHPAFSTFWDLDPEERALISAGGVVQVLVFGKALPPMAVSAAYCRDVRPPAAHVIEGAARAIYETGEFRARAWDALSAGERAVFRQKAEAVSQIIMYWLKTS